MRIATSQMFARPTSLMATLTEKADAIQTSIATGNKFTAPSSDPAAYLRLDGLKRGKADDLTNAANVKLAQGLLGQTDTTLASIETQLQRVNELTVEAANGTLSDDNRVAIAQSLSAITDDLYALANTKDVRGQPLFGSSTGDTAYDRASDGTISFVGAGTPSEIPINNHSSVQATITGDRAFGDMFATLKSLTDALNTGGDIRAAVGGALDGLKDNLADVAAARASVGARGARLDLEADRLTDAAIAREESRTAIEDTDIPSAVAELQKTLTVLQATQASFTKLSGMSLFDYLR
ncbi:flagellin [Sphingomonas sp. LB-2]|uniref:flagellin N-terminal helical domain-containing protein n=1 Tax=Sphingomonas caeni TaxID=2984949 RepID=UPI00222FF640|nr:flagellin [Sphingomonas caeni]MCW3846892.1 flagellin [Sphingomonas caeni]